MALEGPTRSADFYELRAASLTSSRKLQDYGLCAISLGLTTSAVVWWHRLRSILPRTRLAAALFGGTIAILTVAAQIGSLFLDYERGEFPYWADSLGIPLAGMPVILVVLTAWAGFHALLVERREQSPFRLTLRNSNWWLAVLVATTVVILATSVAVGDFWQIIPAALWIIFYLSIWISRSEVRRHHARACRLPAGHFGRHLGCSGTGFQFAPGFVCRTARRFDATAPENGVLPAIRISRRVRRIGGSTLPDGSCAVAIMHVCMKNKPNKAVESNSRGRRPLKRQNRP